MGRIRQMIDVHGRPTWTLFDSGARNTYITPDVAALLVTSETAGPIRTALAMRQWGIRLNPEAEAIDLSHYPNEFVEF